MWRALKMGNTLTVIDRATAYDAMNLIAFLKEELAQIRAVLACDTCDEGNIILFHDQKLMNVCL